MALYIDIKPSEDPAFVLLRTSAQPNPERKPPMRIRRDAIDNVLGATNINACPALHSSGDA